ncbi:MAG TPA: hypothetical protein DCZ18_01505, partial [Gammaproteobacteria bacterium]|nr:hypothetical protein [Gammaproteobacteria bacterium]
FKSKGMIMFGLFKSDPKKKLDQQYKALLEQAMQAQRSGDIRKYSELTELAEAKKRELDQLA